MKKHLLFLIFLFFIVFSCKEYKENKEAEMVAILQQEKTSAEIILLEPIYEIISDIFSNIEFGTNFIEYSAKVKELKSKIDYTKTQVSTETAQEFISEYADICNILTDAYLLWEFTIKHSEMHRANEAIRLKTISFKENKNDSNVRDQWNKNLSDMIEKYDLNIIEDKSYIENTGYTIINYYIYSMPSLQKIWEEALIKKSNLYFSDFLK